MNNCKITQIRDEIMRIEILIDKFKRSEKTDVSDIKEVCDGVYRRRALILALKNIESENVSND